MEPRVIAMALKTFYGLTNLEQSVLQDELTKSLLSLGPEWWKENLCDVMDELVNRYQRPNIAKAVEGFYNFYISIY